MKKITVLIIFLLSTLSNATVVRFETNWGNVDIEMKENAAPLHVDNFLNYVNDGDYDNSIIHRSVPGFVIQGGALYRDGNDIEEIPADPAVTNEFNISNTRGTIAMAKLPNQPNSATNNFFFNLADNNTGSNSLDIQNGGFTVFGEVVSGMEVVDIIASFTVLQGFPLYNYVPGNQVDLDNYVYINRAFVLSETFQINPGLSGAWYNPATDGQGIYIEVLPATGQVIMAWFTFDTEFPDDMTPSEIGYAGNRWLVAIGDFTENVFSGTVYQTSDGKFDDPATVNNEVVGTVSLTFNSCAFLEMSYSLYEGTQNGINTMQRLSGANIELCERLASEANQGVVTQ